MPYAQLKSQLSEQSQSLHIGLIDDFLSTPANIDDLSGTALSELIVTALKANTKEGVALFLRYDALQEKYETDAVKTLFLADPATFTTTRPFPEHLINKVVATLKKDPDTFLENIDHLGKLNVLTDEGEHKVYRISLDDVLGALLTKHTLTVEKDKEFGNRPKYEALDSKPFFKELFEHIFKDNSPVIDDFFNQYSAKNAQHTSFIFRHGHLLTASQSQALFNHDELPALLKRGLETHGYTISIARLPETSLNLIRDKLLLLPSESDEEKAIKLRWLKKLLEYTGNFRQDENKWYGENLATLLNAIHALIPADREYDNIQPLFDTYWSRKPLLVQALLDDKATWLSSFNQTTDAKLQVSKGTALYCFVSALLKNADPGQFKALFELEAVKAFCADSDNNLLDILIGRPECRKGEPSDRQKALEALLDLEEISPHISGDDIQNTTLSDLERTVILSRDSLKDKFQDSKQHRLVNAIFDKKWDTMGRGFFGRKTPTHITKMREALGGQLSTVPSSIDESLYKRLVTMADDASHQTSCLWNTRDKTVQAFYSLIGDDKEDKPLVIQP